MTPDGIPRHEWDRVHDLALDVANASMIEDTVLSEAKTEELLCYLRELWARHGDLPSILGTLADYTDDDLEAYDLYARAIAEAQRIGDAKNLAILLPSILELDCLDADQRTFWQAQLDFVKKEPKTFEAGS
jgi:hypothetical protein